MSSAKPSPSPSPGIAEPDAVSQSQTRRSNASTKGRGDGTTSLKKRVREGSLEPSHAEAVVPDPVATKKNRVASSTSQKSSGPNDLSTQQEDDEEDVGVDAEADADVEGEGEGAKDGTSTQPEEKPVGEVREKVEKMSYEEDQAKKEAQGNKATPASKDGRLPGTLEDKDEVDGVNGDKLKRKALDRSESSLTQEADLTSKRQKDTPPPVSDNEKDDDVNVSASVPAPAPAPAPAPTKKPQSTFSSFASSASPYASLGGATPAPQTQTASGSATLASAPAKKPQATFGAYSSASSPFASSTGTPAAAAPPPAPSTTTAEPAAPVAPKKPQATFGGFASTSSPFASVKPASGFGSAPAKGSAFGNYSTTSSPFATKQAAPLQGSEKAEAGPSNFGDILKETGGDEATEKKVEMHAQDVTTGEEEEETVFQTRAKLYYNDKEAWKERGVGLLKLNVRQTDGGGARLVMRADGVLRLILNSKLYKGLNPQVEGKMVRMSVPNEKEWSIICLRMSNPKVASDLAEHIHSHIPLDGAGPTGKSPKPEEA